MRPITLSIALALVAPAGAQETKTAEVTAASLGQLFSARVTVQTDGRKAETWIFHPHPDGKAHKLASLETGRAYKLRAGHERYGWPQYGAYVVLEGGKEVLRTEPTYEPVTVTLKAGQQLRIEFPRSYEPYDGKYFRVAGVDAAIILPRPYWYQDVGKGQFKGKEPYPNSLFFLVDTEWGWGEEKVLSRMAEYAADKIKDGDVNNGDWRCEAHFSFLVALTPEGGLPPVLTKMDKGELRKIIHAGITQAWADMKQSKCYRPFDGQSGAPVDALKRAGYLPSDWPEERTYISLADGLRLARPLAKKWREEHPERAPKK